METITVEEFCAHPLESLSRSGEAGGLVVSDAEGPIAMVLPIARCTKRRPFGLCKGEFTVPDDFNAPLPEIEAAFYGE